MSLLCEKKFIFISSLITDQKYFILHFVIPDCFANLWLSYCIIQFVLLKYLNAVMFPVYRWIPPPFTESLSLPIMHYCVILNLTFYMLEISKFAKFKEVKLLFKFRQRWTMVLCPLITGFFVGSFAHQKSLFYLRLYCLISIL